VDPESIAAADARQKEINDVKDLEKNMKKMAVDSAKAALIADDRDRDSFPSLTLHDCSGKPFTTEFTWCFTELVSTMAPSVGLKFVDEMNFVLLPLGVRDDNSTSRAIFLRSLENDASILLMFTKLFLDGGEGGHAGTVVDAVYIIKAEGKSSSGKSSSRTVADQRRSHPDEVEWVAVQRPSKTSANVTNSWTWLQLWLQTARSLATMPSNDAFYKKGSRSRAKKMYGLDGP
jgi:hypothetical protein